MNDKENLLQPAAETIPQLADALQSNTEAVRQLTWAYKEGMREFGYAVTLAHCPVDNVKDFTLDHNFNSHSPLAGQFLVRFRESLTRSAQMLMSCDGEITRA
jgi:hypothetical protein